MSGLLWYVVEAQPRSEHRAQENLQLQGFQSFCPRVRKIRNHARRKELVLTPLFPGYLFVRFDRQFHQWRSINGTFGVRRLVASDPWRPQPMPGSAMDFLISRCEPSTGCLADEPFKPGESVRFAKGALINRLATVECLEPGGRVRLLLDILGGYQEVVVPRESLISA